MYQAATIAHLARLLIGAFAVSLTSEGCSRRPDALGGPSSVTSSPAVHGSATSSLARPDGALSSSTPAGFTLELDRQMRTNEPRLVRLRIANGQVVRQLLEQELNRLEGVTAEPLRAIPCRISGQLSGEGFDISALDEGDRPLVDEGDSEWTWQVIPKRAGKGLLVATIRVNSLENRARRPADLSISRDVIVRSP